jgi:hypothetical protein
MQLRITSEKPPSDYLPEQTLFHAAKDLGEPREHRVLCSLRCINRAFGSLPNGLLPGLASRSSQSLHFFLVDFDLARLLHLLTQAGHEQSEEFLLLRL